MDVLSGVFFYIGFVGLIFLSILMFFVFQFFLKKQRDCNTNDVALCHYYTRFWKENNEISDLIINVLRYTKQIHNAYEVFYMMLADDDRFKLAASSKQKFNFLDVQSGEDSFFIHDLIQKCQYNNNNINKKDISTFQCCVDGLQRNILLIPIVVDNFCLGKICVVFDENVIPNFNNDIINIIIGLLKFKEKSEILEEALGKCESDLDSILHISSHGVVILDKNLKIRKINSIACQIIGCNIDDCYGKFINDVIKLKNEDTFVIGDLVKNAIEFEHSTNKNERFVIKSQNGEFVVDFRSAPVYGINGIEGAVLVIRDVKSEEIIERERTKRKEETEKHYLELQMEQEQRREIEKALIKSGALASAGTLAAGIAHEYNNLNAIAMGNIDVLLQMKNLPDFVIGSLKTIRDMMSRGSEITTELLDYTRNNHTNGNKRVLVSLIDIVEKTKKLVSKEFKAEGIVFSSNFDNIKGQDKDKYIVNVDPLRIQQVILNLVLNARHAMIESKKKVVSFEIGLNKDGAYINVSDTGHGIPHDDLSKLFTPFFSTKGEFAKFESQKQFSGTGLGLAICDLIMKKNGGSIGVISEVGVGTTFTLRFDDHEDKKLEIEKHEDHNEHDEIEQIDFKDGKGKKILILDDEVELCRLLQHAFGTYGYDVKVTDDGLVGLNLHKQENFDLIITDIQMPKMTGLEFLNKLSTIEATKKPKKVVMTGRITRQEITDVEFDYFVQKPFDLLKLMAKVQDILEV